MVIQVLCATVPGGAPTTLVQWALAAAAGSAVILTHLALTLLASWPARADLPRATALRWGGQAAALVWVAIGAALLGALATTTPLGWAPWIAAIGLGLIAGTVWQVRVKTRRAEPRRRTVGVGQAERLRGVRLRPVSTSSCRTMVGLTFL